MQLKRALAGAALGALFVGSTLAAAVTLGDFPQPFVQDGQVKGLIVVGAQAQPADVVAAIDLAARLGSEATVEKTVTWSGSAGGDVSVTGTGVSLDTSGSRLHLGDPINAVKQTLTGTDLPGVLGKETFQDDSGTTYDYSQYLDVGGNDIQYLQPDTDMDPVYAVQMDTNSANPVYSLRAVFNKEVNFTSSDVVGKTIKLFGKEFTVSSESTSTKLVLLGSSQEVTINMGEEKTVTVDGTDYTIKVLGFDTTNDKVVLSVNGGAADEVKEGQSKKVNGLQVYAKLVTSWDNGNQGLATLQLGSEKYVFEDNQQVAVGDNEDPIDGTLVTLQGSDATKPVETLNLLKVDVFAADSDHDLIKNGESFTDPVFGTVKVKFAGMSIPSDSDARETIKLRNSGDYKGYVSFTDSLGNKKDVYFAYDNGGNLYLQDASQKNIYVVEGKAAQEDQYVYLAPIKSSDNTQDTGYTHLVKVRRIHADGDGNADDYAEFEDVMSGAVYKTQTFNYADSTAETTTLTVDGKTYTVEFQDGTTPTTVKVYDGNTNYVVVYPAIKTKNGADLALTDDEIITNLDGDTSAGTATKYLVLPTGVVTVNFADGDTGASDETAVAYASGVLTVTEDSNTGGSTPKSATGTVGGVEYKFTVGFNAGESTDVTVQVTDQAGTGLTDPAVLLVEEEDSANVRNAVIVQAKDTSGKLEFAAPVMTATTKYVGVATSDSDKTRGVDVWGTEYLYDQSATDHAVVDLWYPENQVYFGVAVLGPDGDATMGTGSSGGSVTYKEAQPVKVAVAKLDTEVTDADKQNKDMILVGGTTVNSLVRELANGGKLDEAWDGSQWTLAPGEAVIKLVEDAFAQGHVALVVAGTEAADTREAVHVLQNYDDNMDKLSGKTVVKVVNGVVQDFA